MEELVFGSDGQATRQEASSEDVEQLVEARAREMAGEIKLSRAASRLKRLREAAPFESVRRVEVAGDEEPYFVKRGSFPDLTHAAALSGRDERGVLSLQETEGLAGFMAALLRVFCVVSETDASRYFESLEEARAFADDPASGDAAATLFYAIVELNPELWPEGDREQIKNVWAALKAEMPTAFSAPQSPPQETL